MGSFFVFEVAHFELNADIDGLGNFIVSLLCLFTWNESKDCGPINVSSAPVDNSIANLSDEHNKSSRSIVILWVIPDQKDRVHDWLENVNEIWELLGLVCKPIE